MPSFRRREEIDRPTINLVSESTTTPIVKRKPIASSSFSQPRLPSRTNTTISSATNISHPQRSYNQAYGTEPSLPPALRLLPPSTATFPRSQQLFPSPSPGPRSGSSGLLSQTPISQRPPPTANSSRYTPSQYSTNNRLSRFSHSRYSQSRYSRLSTAPTFTTSQESFDTRGERRRSDPFDFDRGSTMR